MEKFSRDKVKIGDRIIHQFEVNGNMYCVYMGWVYGIQPRINGEKALYLMGKSDLIFPEYWNLYIDNRPRYSRMYCKLFNLFS